MQDNYSYFWKIILETLENKFRADSALFNCVNLNNFMNMLYYKEGTL